MKKFKAFIASLDLVKVGIVLFGLAAFVLSITIIDKSYKAAPKTEEPTITQSDFFEFYVDALEDYLDLELERSKLELLMDINKNLIKYGLHLDEDGHVHTHSNADDVEFVKDRLVSLFNVYEEYLNSPDKDIYTFTEYVRLKHHALYTDLETIS